MGVMPKVTNTDPWQLMNAFANAGHRYGPYGRNGNRYVGGGRYNQAAPMASSSYDDALSDYNQDKYDYAGDPGPPPMMTRPMQVASGTDPIGIKGDIPLMIQKAAIARGIDPQVALAVAKSEGGLDGKYRTGDGGSSFGPYQLHMAGIAPGGNSGGGLGDEFAKRYGSAPNATNVEDQINFSLDKAKEGGWGPWHGYKGGRWDGIGSVNADAPIPLPLQRPNDLPQQQATNEQPQGDSLEAQQVADNVDEADPSSRLSWLV